MRPFFLQSSKHFLGYQIQTRSVEMADWDRSERTRSRCQCLHHSCGTRTQDRSQKMRHWRVISNGLCHHAFGVMMPQCTCKNLQSKQCIRIWFSSFSSRGGAWFGYAGLRNRVIIHHTILNSCNFLTKRQNSSSLPGADFLWKWYMEYEILTKI